MTRKTLITAAKLVFAAGLMGFVLSQIQFRDRAVKEEGGKETVLEGELLSGWKEHEVQFLEDGKTEPIEFTPGETTGSVTWSIQPGAVTTVKDMRWSWFLLGSFLYFFACSSSSLRWHWLVRTNGLPLSRWDAFRLTWIGVFFNNVVPGLTGGDLVKAFYVVRHTGEKTRSIVSVVVDRIMGLAGLALLAAIVVLFQIERFKTLALGIYLVLAGTCVLAAMFFSKRLRKALRLDVLLGKLPLSGMLKKVDEAFRFYRDHVPGLLFWLLFSMVNHAISVLAVFCIGEALEIPLPWYEYLVLIPVISIASSVPIAPAGWGVGEALFGYLFKAYGGVATGGVVLSIVYRIQMTVWSLLGGLFVALSKERIQVTEEEEASAEMEPVP